MVLEFLTWHVTIVSYKTHKWKQLDSVLKGQTSYWSQDTLWHPPLACVFNNPKIGNKTQESETRYGSEGPKSISTATRGGRKEWGALTKWKWKAGQTDIQTEISAQGDKKKRKQAGMEKNARFQVLSMRIRIFWDLRLGRWVSGARRFEGTTILRKVRHHSANDTVSHIRSKESSVRQKLENRKV